jgi:hypothetical protein
MTYTNAAPFYSWNVFPYLPTGQLHTSSVLMVSPRALKIMHFLVFDGRRAREAGLKAALGKSCGE